MMNLRKMTEADIDALTDADVFAAKALAAEAAGKHLFLDPVSYALSQVNYHGNNTLDAAKAYLKRRRMRFI